MNRILYVLPIIVIAGLGLLFFTGLRSNSGNEIPSTLIGNPMPALPETGLDGFEAGDIAAIIQDNPVTMVNFFASWCAPCRVEHPNLIALAEQGIPIIGINYKDKPDNAKRFLNELDNPFAALRTDQNGRVAIDWGVSGVPETFFINRDGIVIDRFFGPITEAAMESEVALILEQEE